MTDDSTTVTHPRSQTAPTGQGAGKEGGAQPATGRDFIRSIIEADLASGKHQRVVSRFPPEPNGYLHIGHAKSICLNFGVAKEYGGVCHLRFDDTNPSKEDVEYVESIQNDVHWLGFDWGENLFYASDYFERLYEWAIELIETGKAYVCELDEAAMREYRGTINEVGKPSPHRDRPAQENLDLFRRMRAGEFPDGSLTLRAKIDMASPNMKMRDPPLYRIRRHHHYRQGDKWCIYPLYDFTHGLSDSIEGITHSLCTLEFENNRELYDWFLDNLTVPCKPRQIEFARLNLNYTVMSKRKLLQLVTEKLVHGWDDPRMPTIAGFRRRGYTPEAIREFCDRIGVAKNNSVVDVGLLEFTIREDLNQKAPRVQCVLDPLQVVIENYPEEKIEEIDAPYFPHDVPKEGSRPLPFSKKLFIEREDFQENPPKNWYRLSPGAEVRLRYAYVIRCDAVEKDGQGKVVRLRCSYDEKTLGEAPAGRKVKGTLHWVSAAHAQKAEVRLYDRLFSDPEPDRSDRDFKEFLNPNSLVVTKEAVIERSLAQAKVGERFQFERLGFFIVDEDSKSGALVFNRVVTLKDGWAKVAKKAEPAPSAKPAAAASQNKSAKKHKGGGKKGKQKEPLSDELASFRDAHGLGDDEARRIGSDADFRSFFDAALAEHADAKGIAKWLVNDVAREAKGKSLADLAFGSKELAELVALIGEGRLSSQLAKEVFAEMAKSGASPREIAARDEFSEIATEAELLPFIVEAMAAKPDLVERYRQGNENLLSAFLGQVMRATRGRAKPELLERVLRQELRG